MADVRTPNQVSFWNYENSPDRFSRTQLRANIKNSNKNIAEQEHNFSFSQRRVERKAFKNAFASLRKTTSISLSNVSNPSITTRVASNQISRHTTSKQIQLYEELYRDNIITGKIVPGSINKCCSEYDLDMALSNDFTKDQLNCLKDVITVCNRENELLAFGQFNAPDEIIHPVDLFQQGYTPNEIKQCIQAMNKKLDTILNENRSITVQDLHNIRKTFDNIHFQSEIENSGKFSIGQQYVLNKAFKNGISEEDMKHLLHPELSVISMEKILGCIENGMSKENLDIISGHRYDPEQISAIEYAMDKGIEGPSLFLVSDPYFPSEQMYSIINAIDNGANYSDFKRIQYTQEHGIDGSHKALSNNQVEFLANALKEGIDPFIANSFIDTRLSDGVMDCASEIIKMDMDNGSKEKFLEEMSCYSTSKNEERVKEILADAKKESVHNGEHSLDSFKEKAKQKNQERSEINRSDIKIKQVVDLS